MCKGGIRMGMDRALWRVVVLGIALSTVGTRVVATDVVDFSDLFDGSDAGGGLEVVMEEPADDRSGAADRHAPVLQARILELEHLVGVRDRQIEELKQALEEVTSEFGSRIAEMRSQRGAEEADVASELRASLEEAAAKYARLEEDHAAEQQSQEAALEKMRADLQALQETMEADVAEMRAAHRALEASKAAALTAQAAELEAAQAAALTAQAAELEAAQEAALADLRGSHRAERDALQAEFAAFRAESAKDREAAARLRGEVSRLEAALRVEKAANERERFLLAYNSGSLFLAAGRYDRAEREFLKALAVRENDAPLHYNMGILYGEHLKQPAKARRHYERFLELAPNDRDAPVVMQWLRELR